MSTPASFSSSILFSPTPFNISGIGSSSIRFWPISSSCFYIISFVCFRVCRFFSFKSYLGLLVAGCTEIRFCEPVCLNSSSATSDLDTELFVALSALLLAEVFPSSVLSTVSSSFIVLSSDRPPSTLRKVSISDDWADLVFSRGNNSTGGSSTRFETYTDILLVSFLHVLVPKNGDC